MSKLIDRLEQALRTWENMMYSTSLYAEAASHIHETPARIVGPVRYWHELRKYLIHFRGEDFDFRRFTLAGSLGSAMAFDGFPASLAAWSAYSRCVYHLSPKLQALLELTPVNNLRWRDVPWPFTSFCLWLERPVVNLQGQSCDLVMVSRRSYYHEAAQPAFGPKPNVLELRLIPQGVSTAPTVSRKLAKEWELRKKRKQWAKLASETQTFSQALSDADIQQELAILPIVDSEYVTDTLDGGSSILIPRPGHRVDIGLSDSMPTGSALALRLAVGISFYLSTVTNDSPLLEHERIDPPEGDLCHPITRGADICRVLSDYILSPEERESLGEGLKRPYHEVSPHWRRGYFRRPKGQGKNPNAKKTVWIYPVKVRKDRLAPNAQVGGSHVDVK